MSRLGIRLAAAFVLVVAATLSAMTARSIHTIRTSQERELNAVATVRLRELKRECADEARRVAARLLPLAAVRELRFRAQSSSSATREAVGPVDPVGLQRFLEEIFPVTGLDFLEVTNRGGEVLARGHFPEAFGEMIVDPLLIGTVQNGQPEMGIRSGRFRAGDFPVLASAVPIQSEWREEEFSAGVLSGGIRLDRLAVRLGKLSGGLVEIATASAVISSKDDGIPPSSLGLVTGWNDLEELWWIAEEPLDIDGLSIGVLRVGIPASESELSKRALIEKAIYDSIVAVALAAAAGLVLSLGPTRRLKELTAAAIRIGSGDLSAPVSIKGHDEIGILGETLSATAAALRIERARLAATERTLAWRDAARRLAHELKNAITPIGLSLQTIRRAAAKGDEGKLVADEALTAIGDELKQLGGLVDEFSNFARLPAPRFRPYDLSKALQSATALYRSSNEDSETGEVEIRLNADVVPLVSADEELMGRVWSNLIANAVHAAREGRSTPRVEVDIRRSGGEDGSGSAVVEIRDSGEGLPAEKLERGIVEGQSTKTGGWGVGLALVERIVAEHGGTLTLTNRVSEGAAVRVLLPFDMGTGFAEVRRNGDKKRTGVK